jgi:GNAT superfamily N-acetyltransferase
VQALFDDNPGYFEAVYGRVAEPGEAQSEFEELPPPHIGYTRQWFAGLFDADERLAGVAVVLSDLCAAEVWHIGLFMLAARLHGAGVARSVHAAIEAWATRNGARWLRLGVVRGNARAERFWSRNGYLEVRTRVVDADGLANEVRVMVKPLGAADIASYLERVPRDRPGATLP